MFARVQEELANCSSPLGNFVNPNEEKKIKLAENKENNVKTRMAEILPTNFVKENTFRDLETLENLDKHLTSMLEQTDVNLNTHTQVSPSGIVDNIN